MQEDWASVECRMKFAASFEASWRKEMKTGRGIEAHMYHQAFRRSCRANARKWEGVDVGEAVQKSAGGAASGMQGACARHWRPRTLHAAQKGRA